MLRRASLLSSIALAAVACSGADPADCPPSSKRIAGRCALVCASDLDCLARERCDPSLQVCIPGSGAGDAGDRDAEPSDLGTPGDAQTDAGLACEGLGEDGCEAAGCVPVRCPSCPEGTSSFVTCIAPGDPLPGCAPPPPCEACRDLTEVECNQALFCKSAYCAGCDGVEHFTGCWDGNASPPACEPPECGCARHLELSSCDDDPGCHPVYAEQPVCTCPTPGCCMVFTFCGEGATASCAGEVTCRIPEPICSGDYVVAYRDQCYEGCVRRSDCRQ